MRADRFAVRPCGKWMWARGKTLWIVREPWTAPCQNSQERNRNVWCKRWQNLITPRSISEARAKYESISKALDVDRLTAEAKDLEVKAAEPGLWDESGKRTESDQQAVRGAVAAQASGIRRPAHRGRGDPGRAWPGGRGRRHVGRGEGRSRKHPKGLSTIWRSRRCLTANTTNVPPW